MIEGYGCDIYIEASGHPSSVEQGLHAIRKLGILSSLVYSVNL